MEGRSPCCHLVAGRGTHRLVVSGGRGTHVLLFQVVGVPLLSCISGGMVPLSCISGGRDTHVLLFELVGLLLSCISGGMGTPVLYFRW